MLNRRGLFSGVVGLVSMPAIVRAESLMKIKPIKLYYNEDYTQFYKLRLLKTYNRLI